MDRCFSFLNKLVDRENNFGAGYSVVMFGEFFQLGVDVLVHGIGYVNVVSADIDLHGQILVSLHESRLSRL